MEVPGVPRAKPAEAPRSFPEVPTTAHGPYSLYGLRVVSDWPLPFPTRSQPDLPYLYLRKGTAAAFAETDRLAGLSSDRSQWFSQRQLNDGRLFLRWSDLFEFLISPDGSVIFGRPLRADTYEAFRIYLLNQVASFALILRGREPLHATAVATDSGLVAFLGDSGYGKSTLGAVFLGAGHRIITDDLLCLETTQGIPIAFPGPPQIKLFPHVAEYFLGPRAAAGIMTSVTTKLVLALLDHEWQDHPLPLKAIYVLNPVSDSSSSRIAIERLTARQAFLQLVANTFNTVVRNEQRLRRQLIVFSRMVSLVPVRWLTYPRGLDRLAAVREAVLTDLLS